MKCKRYGLLYEDAFEWFICNIWLVVPDPIKHKIWLTIVLISWGDVWKVSLGKHTTSTKWKKLIATYCLWPQICQQCNPCISNSVRTQLALFTRICIILLVNYVTSYTKDFFNYLLIQDNFYLYKFNYSFSDDIANSIVMGLLLLLLFLLFFLNICLTSSLIVFLSSPHYKTMIVLGWLPLLKSSLFY